MKRFFLLVVAGTAAIAFFILWQQTQHRLPATGSMLNRKVEEDAETSQPSSGITGPLRIRGFAQDKPMGEGAVSTSDGGKNVDGPDAAGGGSAETAINRVLAKDEKYRESMELSLRTQVIQMHADLADELQLSPSQAKKLFEVITTTQLALVLENLSDANRIDHLRAAEEKIAALLGSEKYGQWVKYQQSLGIRSQVQGLAATLTVLGMPMAPLVQKQLTAALVIEHERQVHWQPRLDQPADLADRQSAILNMRLRRAEETSARNIGVARVYLDPQQVEIFRKLQYKNIGVAKAMLRSRQLQKGEVAGVEMGGAN